MAIDMSRLRPDQVRDLMDQADLAALQHFMEGGFRAVYGSVAVNALGRLDAGETPTVVIAPETRGGVRIHDGVAEMSPATATALVNHFRRRGAPEPTPELASAVDSVLGAAMRQRLGSGDPTRAAFGAAYMTDPHVREGMLTELGMSELAEQPPSVIHRRRTAAAETIVMGLHTISGNDSDRALTAAHLAQFGAEAPELAGFLALGGDRSELRGHLDDPAAEEARIGEPLREAFQAMEDDEVGINARQQRGDQVQLGRLDGIKAVTQVQMRLVDTRQRVAIGSEDLADQRMSPNQVETEKAKIEAKAAWRATRVLYGAGKAGAYVWATGAAGRFGMAWLKEKRENAMEHIHLPQFESGRAARREAPISADFFRPPTPPAREAPQPEADGIGM
ncbi:MAG TPA: hypothetical protein VIA06_16205 [Candidatus Dormibacteraeota bacterium]|jgi:hypothetical protein|nr:hypothetical protein [Candidatus Dormibacteraeota bacterium]